MSIHVHFDGTYTPSFLQWFTIFNISLSGHKIPEGSRTCPQLPKELWNHYVTMMIDPEYPFIHEPGTWWKVSTVGTRLALTEQGLDFSSTPEQQPFSSRKMFASAEFFGHSVTT